MSNKRQQSTHNHHESGMVAIFVSMIMIIVISLVVLGFAQITRRNQRTTLDSQLSTQAYYAAESGVNDAVAALKTLATTNPPGTPLPEKTACADGPNYNFIASGKNQLDGTNVTYSCVLIDPHPTAIDFTLGKDAVVVPLAARSGLPLASITLTWLPEPGKETLPMTDCYSLANLGRLPNAEGALNWVCKYAALRTDLVNTTVLSRAGWQANTTSNVLEPINTAAVAAMPAATDGQVVAAACTDTPRTCRVTISGLSAARYFLKVSAIYRTTTLTITGTDSSGAAVEFTGAQAKIDATGKARDVLRRIVVGVDLANANNSAIPNAGIATADSICKRFLTTPGYFNNEDYLGGNGSDLCTAADSGSPSP